MTEAQSKAVLNLLSNLTHAIVQHSHEIPHNEKVELLDELCEVKRQFGVEDDCPQAT